MNYLDSMPNLPPAPKPPSIVEIVQFLGENGASLHLSADEFGNLAVRIATEDEAHGFHIGGGGQLVAYADLELMRMGKDEHLARLCLTIWQAISETLRIPT